MKFFVLLCLFGLSVIIHGHSILSDRLKDWDPDSSAKELIQSQWAHYKLKYKKQHLNEMEELYRMKVFVENSIKIAKHNQEYAKGKISFKMGINQFSDRTHEEFRDTLIKSYWKTNRSEEVPRFIPPAHVTIPDAVDWRKQGAVTGVKSQGRCGSCYSFSATGALEGQHFRKTHKLVSLSEQNLVDCSQKYGNRGCDGGLPDNSFMYIKNNNGIDTEESYPYEGKVGRCRYKVKNRGATDKGYMEVEPTDEDDLKAAVATIGPIAVFIDARHPSLKDYKEGVYYEPNCSSEAEDLGHTLLVVGYGTDPDDDHPDYWLLKNSWAKSWGESGYMRLARNEDNHCGIATWPVYPIV